MMTWEEVWRRAIAASQVHCRNGHNKDDVADAPSVDGAGVAQGQVAGVEVPIEVGRDPVRG